MADWKGNVSDGEDILPRMTRGALASNAMNSPGELI
jgi:hypothetical protein